MGSKAGGTGTTDYQNSESTCEHLKPRSKPTEHASKKQQTSRGRRVSHRWTIPDQNGREPRAKTTRNISGLLLVLSSVVS